MNERVSRYIGLHDKEVAPWTKGEDLGDVSWQSLMYKPMKDAIEKILISVNDSDKKEDVPDDKKKDAGKKAKT